MKFKRKSFVRKNPSISLRRVASIRKSSRSTEETFAELSIDKVFRIQDYYAYKVSKEQRKEKKVNVNRNPIGKEKYEILPYLILPSNVANILTVRRSIDKLVTKYSWDWADAMEQLLDDTTLRKIKEIKSSYSCKSDDENYRHVFTQLIKDISQVENPLKEQVNYLSNIKRQYLHDNNEMEPEKFYELMVEVNELLTWIDPTVKDGNQLSEEELWAAFLQAQKPEWSIEAKEQGIENDKEKYFEFLKSQWEFDLLYVSLTSSAFVA